jgi:hypothetical protein
MQCISKLSLLRIHVNYSAQLMLDKFSLVELLAMDLHQLQDNLPWMPVKILKVSNVAISGIQYQFMSCNDTCT